jgi:hypothetical protein
MCIRGFRVQGSGFGAKPGTVTCLASRQVSGARFRVQGSAVQGFKGSGFRPVVIEIVIVIVHDS